MAKSVHDAGWSQLKTMLEYKCHEAGVVFLGVNESNTTQTCSSCGEKPPSRPKGIAGLGIRQDSHAIPHVYGVGNNKCLMNDSGIRIFLVSCICSTS